MWKTLKFIEFYNFFQYNLYQMNFYSFISFLFLFIYLYLGIKTLINDYKNKLNILFSLACFSMVNWNLILGIMYYVKSTDTLLLLSKFAYIGKFFFFPLNFHFFLVLTKTKIKRWILILFYLPSLILNIAAFMGFFYFINRKIKITWK